MSSANRQLLLYSVCVKSLSEQYIKRLEPGRTTCYCDCDSRNSFKTDSAVNLYSNGPSHLNHVETLRCDVSLIINIFQVVFVF